MGVRSGTEPRHQDDDVRFRVSYFYRVFDYCANPAFDKHDPNRIQSDALYRFRMTGKANALFTKVIFESGTLKSYEIDPLGASIAFDKKNGRFHYQSREATERAANCGNVEDEMERLTRRVKSLSALKAKGDASYNNLIKAFNTRLETLASSRACLPDKIVKSQTPLPTNNSMALRSAGRELRGVKEVKVDIKPSVDPKVTLTVNLTTVHTSLNAAGKGLADLESGSDSRKAFLSATKALQNIKVDEDQSTLVTTDGEASAKKKIEDAQTKIRELIGSVNTNLKGAGLALEEMVKQPTSGLFYLSYAGTRLIEAGDKFDGLASFLGNGKNFVETPVKGYAPEGTFKSIQDAASALRNTGRHLQSAAVGSSVAANSCAPGENLERGFQVIGPQGSTTFDQDDRLIMAMSTSASPLLEQLKDISNRVLAEQQSPGDSLLQLVKARLKITQAKAALSKDKTKSGEIEDMGKKALKGVQK